MNHLDFAAYLSAGNYGGLVFSILAAAGIALFAWRLRRGTPRQLARAVLVCLFACCLSFLPIWWQQTRFDLLGPTLAPTEVAFWLGWAALFAWGVPLGTAAGYLMLSARIPATGRVEVPSPERDPFPLIGLSPHPVELRDPRRLDEPLGAGRAWGQLTPLQGTFAGRPIPLTRTVTLIGRESVCDLVVDDELASRQHAELHWDRGRFSLVERGSLNGTRVNGQGVVGQVPLRAGDIVEIGDQRFRFEPRASGSGVRAPLEGARPGESADDGEPEDPDDTRKVVAAGRPAQPSRPLAPALQLVMMVGPEPGREWDLVAPVITLGRDPVNDICLPDLSVSRQHAQIVRQASGLYVHDLGSENGTCLDSQELTGPAALYPGCVLVLGDVELRCDTLALGQTSIPDLADESRMRKPVTPPDTLSTQSPSASPAAQWGTPAMQHMMGPPPEQRDRPRLGPPRLFPDETPRLGGGESDRKSL